MSTPYGIGTGVAAFGLLCLFWLGGGAEPSVLAQPGEAQGAILDEDPSGLRFGAAQPFSREIIIAQTEALARLPYSPPEPFTPAWASLSFDEHRAIRFQEEHAISLSDGGEIELHLLPPGRTLNNRVRINVVEQRRARQILFDAALFSFGEGAPENLPSDDLDFSGFRLHHVLESTQGAGRTGESLDAHGTADEPLDEFLVFQGASYFRAVARDQVYGLSARGLAIDIGAEAGEEFPIFTQYWLEKAAGADEPVIIHAQLDTPKAAGIFTFKITPGATTRMDVSVVLFPRTEIQNFGLAPLTSMFLFDQTNRSRFDDFRSAVHDSDGLAIHNGAGEWLWRPLANPRSIQESAFVDNNPQGFGLIQRARDYESFGDLSLRYEARPSVWIEPKGNWGRGSVTLIELPTNTETDDNIVAYWRPIAPFLAGERYEFAYRITWGATVPITDDLLKVIDTRIGAHPSGRKIMVIDYAAIPGSTDFESDERVRELVPEIYSGQGVVQYPFIEANSHTGGVRLTFQYDPQEASSSEFRILLRRDGRAVSEKWLYRWTQQ